MKCKLEANHVLELMNLRSAGIPFPYAVTQLSNLTELPFPFVGDTISKQFRQHPRDDKYSGQGGFVKRFGMCKRITAPIFQSSKLKVMGNPTVWLSLFVI